MEVIRQEDQVENAIQITEKTAQATATALIRQRQLQPRRHRQLRLQLRHQGLLRDQLLTANAAGANGAMLPLVVATQPLEVGPFATMISLTLVVVMVTAKASHHLDLRHHLRVHLDHHHHHHRRLTRHILQLLQLLQPLAVWSCWVTWRIGVLTSSGGMRTCQETA